MGIISGLLKVDTAASRKCCLAQGFTLLELLVVILLLSLMVVIVPPGLSRPANAEIKIVTQNMVSALRYTRSLAIAKKQEATFDLDVKERLYRYPGRFNSQPFTESLRVKYTAARSEFFNDTTGSIRFYPDGSSTGGEILISQDQRQQKISVSWITGKVSVHD